MISQSQQGAVVVLGIDVPLNEESGGALVNAVDKLPRGGRPQVVIDMSATPLIDSAGCESMLDCRDKISPLGGSIRLAGVAPLCQDILTATGLDASFERFDGVNEAVASFAR